MSVSGLITDPFSRVWNRRASAHTIHTRLRSEFAALRELHTLSCGVKSSGWFSLFFFILVRNTLEACNKFQQNSQRRDLVFVPLRSLFLRLKAACFCFYLRMSIITILHKNFFFFFFKSSFATGKMFMKWRYGCSVCENVYTHVCCRVPVIMA